MSSTCINSNDAIGGNTSTICEHRASDGQLHNLVRRVGLIWIARILSRVQHHVVTRYNQRIDRQAFNTLLRLDDNLLKDIGVTRLDIVMASQRPLNEDASAILADIVRRK